jgi:translation initiation factor 3 subunit B
LVEEFRQYKEDALVLYYTEKDTRLELRDGIDTDELESHIENFEEETIEFLVKVEETILE